MYIGSFASNLINLKKLPLLLDNYVIDQDLSLFINTRVPDGANNMPETAAAVKIFCSLRGVPVFPQREGISFYCTKVRNVRSLLLMRRFVFSMNTSTIYPKSE